MKDIYEKIKDKSIEFNPPHSLTIKRGEYTYRVIQEGDSKFTIYYPFGCYENYLRKEDITKKIEELVSVDVIYAPVSADGFDKFKVIKGVNVEEELEAHKKLLDGEGINTCEVTTLEEAKAAMSAHGIKLRKRHCFWTLDQKVNLLIYGTDIFGQKRVFYYSLSECNLTSIDAVYSFVRHKHVLKEIMREGDHIILREACETCGLQEQRRLSFQSIIFEGGSVCINGKEKLKVKA